MVVHTGEVGEPEQLDAAQLGGVGAGRLQGALPSLLNVKTARLLDHNDDIVPYVALSELVDKVRLLLQPGIFTLLVIKLACYGIHRRDTNFCNAKLQINGRIWIPVLSSLFNKKS